MAEVAEKVGIADREVGRPIPRFDGVAKVTGRAKYVDDLDFPGALYGRTVRSQVPHGVLRGIERDPAFDWSDIIFVTAEDIPAKNVITLIEDDQPALVAIGARVMHVDEAVALVAAPTKERAAAAMRHVRLVIDPLPGVFDMKSSLAAEVKLYKEDNVFKEYNIRRGGDIDEAMASADLVIEGEYYTGAQEQMYIETQGIVAGWDDENVCRVVGSIQCPYYVLKALKPLLGLGQENVIVTQSVTGGGFGGKEEYPSMLAAHAALLAKKAGRRAVKMIYERSEDVAATTKRHPAWIRHRLGLKRDGTIVAADVDVVMDGGAYATLSAVVLSRGVLHASGPYKIPNVHIRGRVMATNTPPHGAFRGFGAPQTTFAYERQMDKAARALGIDPFELRRRNMLRLGDVTATGQTLKMSVGSAQVLDAVEEQLKQPKPSGSMQAPQGDHVKRGRGLAFYFHGAGFTGSGEERLKGTATVAVTKEGEIEVRSASTDIGQGTITIFAQIAGDALGLPADAIRVIQPTTERVPDSGPTVASRTTMVVGSVVEKASLEVRAILEAFAKERGLEARDLGAVARAYGKERGELARAVVYSPPSGVRWDDVTYSGDAYPCYGWAACVVDVAVDLDTYEVTIERCIHAIDVGKAIHPVLVKGQIEGGTLQALGWALWESVLYDEGRVRNKRMTDCIIPTSMEAPELETLLVEEPYPFGPHGAKGVGEIPMDGPAAAVAAAISDALGVPFDELPILPETVEGALTRAKAT